MALPFDFNILFAQCPHIVTEIVGNIPPKYRWDVARLNSSFYEVVCDVDNFKLRISDDISEELLEEVLVSSRKFDEFIIDNLSFNATNMDRLSQIAAKHNESVKKLTLQNCSLDFANFDAFYNCMKNLPNLIEWNVFNYPNSFNRGSEIELKMLQFISPIFKALKAFRVRLPSSRRTPQEDSHQIFCLSKLIAIGSLETLSVSADNVRNFGMILEAQPNLISLDINRSSGDIFNTQMYQHLQLREFGCSENHREDFLCNFIRSQPSLQKLNYWPEEGIWRSELISAMCFHGNNLTVIDVMISNANCAALLSIRQLHHLEEVHLDIEDGFDQIETFLEFSRIPMRSVKELVFLQCFLELGGDDDDDFSPPIDASTAKAVLQNFGKFWPNVEKLTCPTKFSQNDEISQGVAALILKSFKKVNSLRTKIYDLIDFEQNQKFCNIRELEVAGSCSAVLPVIFQSMPNLMRVQFSCMDTDIEITQSLLNLQKLKKVYAYFDCTKRPSIEEMEAIQQLSKHVLKYRMEWSSRNAENLEGISTVFENDIGCEERIKSYDTADEPFSTPYSVHCIKFTNVWNQKN